MASIPGFRFDITGASGTQGLLSPQSSWRAYILPRGGHASQDSTGTLITFDSADVASRFAVNDWFQAALLTANIRQVSAVGGNSIAFSGAAMTVSENDRIFLIGTTQPTVTGGSATYTTPATIIRQRDDDGSTIFTNSQITSNVNGLIQGFAATNFYDAIIQDGNQANQGFLVDISVGVVEGVSVSQDALFGATLTVNGAFGVTGVATFGSTVTMNAALGVTGWATFGSTVTMNSTLGVTDTATFGTTMVIVGTSGNYNHAGTATFGGSVTINVGTDQAITVDKSSTGNIFAFIDTVAGNTVNQFQINRSGPTIGFGDGDAIDSAFGRLEAGVVGQGGGVHWRHQGPVEYLQANVTIATGIISVTRPYHVVVSETGASDTLTTINDGTTAGIKVGQILVLEAESGDTITVDDLGNIELGASTRVLSSPKDKLMLIYDGAEWNELSFAENA